MKYTSVEQLFSAVKDRALTVCAVTNECVYGFSATSAGCTWSENDIIIYDKERKAYIAIDKNDLISIEKTDCIDSVEYEVNLTHSVITIDVFKKDGER